MKDVIDVKIINILTGDHIDFIVPLFIEFKKSCELSLLCFREVRKILEYQLSVIHPNLKSKIYNRN